MIQNELNLAGLRTLVVGDLRRARQLVVFLHGYTMQPEDLAPFTQTLRVGHTAYALPQAHLDAPRGGHTWWQVDETARQQQLRHGPRDLADAQPAGLPEARRHVEQLLTELLALAPRARLVLGGFSQGGMLACDVALHTAWPLHALFMLSTSMLSQATWAPQLIRLRGLPTLVAHGRTDQNLSFAAGERLRDALSAAGASVQWLAFDGEHQIPLTVWRQLRRFLHERAEERAEITPPPSG